MLRGSVIGVGLCWLVAAGCAGTTRVETRDDGGAGSGATKPGAGGAPAGRGGAGRNFGGSMQVGGAGATTRAGGGGDPSLAGEGGMAGSGAEAGSAGKGGESGGAAGEVATHTCEPEVYPASGCNNAEPFAQGPGFHVVPGATTAAECRKACEATPDCESFNTYFELGPDVGGCEITRDGCDNPDTSGTGDDTLAGRTYVKGACNEDQCDYTPIGHKYCGYQGDNYLPENTASLDDCIDLCNDDAECTAVVDFYYLEPVAGHCFINTEPCDEPILGHQGGTLYVCK